MKKSAFIACILLILVVVNSNAQTLIERLEFNSSEKVTLLSQSKGLTTNVSEKSVNADSSKKVLLAKDPSTENLYIKVPEDAPFLGPWKVSKKNLYWKWDWEEDFWVFQKDRIWDVHPSYHCAYMSLEGHTLTCKWYADIGEFITTIVFNNDWSRFKGKTRFTYYATGSEGEELLEGSREKGETASQRPAGTSGTESSISSSINSLKTELEKFEKIRDEAYKTLKMKKKERELLLLRISGRNLGGAWSTRGYAAGDVDLTDPRVRQAIDLGGPSLMQIYDPIYRIEHLSQEISLWEITLKEAEGEIYRIKEKLRSLQKN